MKRWLLLIIIWPNLLLAQEKIFVASPEWVQFVKKDGTGIYMEIITPIFERNGYELVLIVTPYARALKVVQNGEKDIMFGTYSRRNLDKLGFGLKLFTPRYPLNVEKTVVVFKKDKIPNWKGENTLRDQNVLAIRGYDYDKIINVPMKYMEIDRHQQAFAMLELGRVDFFVDEHLSMLAYINETNIDITPYRIETIKVENLYIAMPDNEHGRKLGAIFDKEMPQQIESGFVSELYRKAGLEPPVLKPEEE